MCTALVSLVLELGLCCIFSFRLRVNTIDHSLPCIAFFFKYSVLPIFLVLCYQRSIIIHDASWGGHKSHREEGFSTHAPPEGATVSNKSAAAVFSGRGF